MKIIENLVEKIDGALSFVSIGAMAIVDTILSGKTEEELLRETPAVEPIIKSEVVRSNPPEKILDACLMIITSVSFLIVERKDLM